MFYHRCSLIEQINTILSQSKTPMHDGQLVDKRNKLFSNSFMIRMLYIHFY